MWFQFLANMLKVAVFIGPESYHWLCLSVTDSLTDSYLVNLIDVRLLLLLIFNSDEDRVGNSLLQIWKLRFVHKA